MDCQAPLCMGFSRQEYWSGLPFPSPGDLPYPGIERGSPALQADSLPWRYQEGQGGIIGAQLIVFVEQMEENSIGQNKDDTEYLQPFAQNTL